MASTPGPKDLAEAFVAVPGATVEMFRQVGPAAGPHGVSDTSNYQPFHANFTQTFNAPVAGTYMIVATGSIFGNGGSAGARIRLKFDNGLAGEQTVGDDDRTWALQCSANFHEARTWVGSVELTAGSHTIRPECKKDTIYGASDPAIDDNSSWIIRAVLVSGSGAGGALLASAELAAPYSSSVSHEAWQDIDNGSGDALSVTFDAVGDEPVLVLVKTSTETTAGSGGSLFARLVVNGVPIAGTQIGNFIGPDNTVNLVVLPFIVTGLVKGSNTIKAQGRSAAPGDTWEWIREAGTSNTDRGRPTLQVLQFRGGLVPVKADGVEVTSAPRFLNFVGAHKVVDALGGVDISLPDAVTAPGDVIEVTPAQVASDITFTGTYGQFFPAAGSSSFTTAAAGTYRVVFRGVFWGKTGQGSSQIKLVFDEGESNEQDVGGDTDDRWRTRTHNTELAETSLTAVVTLTAGSHTVKAYGKNIEGVGPTVVGTATTSNMPLINLQMELISGSGAGGEIVTKTLMETTSDAIDNDDPTWEPIQVSAVDALKITVEVSEGEELLIEAGGSWRPDTAAVTHATFSIWNDTDAVMLGADQTLSSETSSSSGDVYRNLNFKRFTGPLTAGTYVFTLKAYRPTFGTKRDSVMLSGFILCRQMRGGLVPVRADGETKVDKPAALNFIGADVIDQGGVADISLPAAVTAVGDQHILSDGQPATDITLLSTDTLIAPASGSFSFSTKTDGEYAITFALTLYATAATTVQVKVVFDEGTSNEQTVGYDDQWQARITTTADRQTPSFFGSVTLSEGAHTAKVYAKETVGSSAFVLGLATAADRAPVLRLVAVTGSGAGGSLVSEKTLASDFAVGSTSTWFEIDNGGGDALSVDVDCSEGERLLVTAIGEFNEPTTGGWTIRAAVAVDGTRIRSNGDYITSNDNRWDIIQAAVMTPELTGGSHTISLQVFATKTGNVKAGIRFQVSRLRGGLVPVRADGVTKIDKPAALNFIGAEVLNTGGVADISLPNAVTVPGTFVQMFLGQPASTQSISSGTFVDIPGSALPEQQFTIATQGTYKLDILMSLISGTVDHQDNAAEFRIVFDEGGFNGHTEQILTDDGSVTTEFILRAMRGVGSNVLSNKTVQRTITLDAGVHKVKYQARADANTPRVGTSHSYSITGVLLAGSGAGGVISDVPAVITSPPFTVSSTVTWEDVPGVSKTISGVVDEWVLLIFNARILHPTIAHESFIRIVVDGVTYSTVGGDTSVDIGPNAAKYVSVAVPFKFTASSHVIKGQFFSTSTGTELTTSDTGQGLSVLQFRGGLVPVAADGITKIDKPAKLNFIGAEVLNQGGVADISLPASVSAVGFRENVLVYSPAPTFKVVASSAHPTYADLVDTNSVRVEDTFTVPHTSTYRVVIRGIARLDGTTSGAISRLGLRAIFDQSGYNGFTEQTIAPPSSTDDVIFGTVITNQSAVANARHAILFESEVDLEQGTHKVTIQGWTKQIANTINASLDEGDWLVVSLEAITG
jgi:hypothetical protein